MPHSQLILYTTSPRLMVGILSSGNTEGPKRLNKVFHPTRWKTSLLTILYIHVLYQYICLHHASRYSAVDHQCISFLENGNNCRILRLIHEYLCCCCRTKKAFLLRRRPSQGAYKSDNLTCITLNTIRVTTQLTAWATNWSILVVNSCLSRVDQRKISQICGD